MDDRKDKTVRQAIVEGIFYPAEKEELTALVESFTQNNIRGKSTLLYTPHAGYSAAGRLIGRAFSSASDRTISEVVIISPVHREENDMIILPRFKFFSSPLGKIPVNMKSLHLFQGEEKTIIRDDIPHLEEHAIEDQLPFIQHLFPEASILPVLMGKTTIKLAGKLASALERAYGDNRENVLFVVSGNLSTYTGKEDSLAVADRALSLFSRGDWRSIIEGSRAGEIEACGAGALSAVLKFLGKPLSMDVLDRFESVGKESEKGKTVAYGALSFIEE
ncbi:MAG: AmmeMemoRadiSam system protein B [Spirochaetales bacterium]|nr:AmmeMemoRadiSam system protein B [Spirochaetales bacterium]